MSVTPNTTTGRRPRWTVEDRLRKAREVAGLSVNDCAARLGVHRNTVTNWEHATAHSRQIPRWVLLAYSAETGVSRRVARTRRRHRVPRRRARGRYV